MNNKFNDKKLKFYPGKHTYWYGRQKLNNVTSIVHKYFKPFDAKKIARMLSKFPVNRANGRGVRYYLNHWKEMAERGSLIHDEIDKFLSDDSSEFEAIADDLDLKTSQAIEWVSNFSVEERETPMKKTISEALIYNKELGLAGAIDWIVIYEDDTFEIIDWKSNKKFTTKGFKGQKGIHPITEELEDSHLVKYSLQLSFYAYMIEQGYGLKCRGLRLIWLTEDSHKEYSGEYMKDKVKEILDNEVK